MKKNKIFEFVVLASVLWFGTVTAAEMQNTNPASTPIQDSVLNMGKMDEWIVAVQDSGTDIPFVEGLKKIVPDGWHAYKQKNIDVPGKISWKSGLPWVETLRGIGAAAHLTFMINWDLKTVHVIQPKAIKNSLQPSPNNTNNAPTINGPTDKKQIAGVGTPSKHLEIAPGLVRDAFDKVTKHYGYELHWIANEKMGVYKFSYPVVLFGIDIQSDLNILNDALGSGKQSLFSIDLYQGNKVVRVKSQGD